MNCLTRMTIWENRDPGLSAQKIRIRPDLQLCFMKKFENFCTAGEDAASDDEMPQLINDSSRSTTPV